MDSYCDSLREQRYIFLHLYRKFVENEILSAATRNVHHHWLHHSYKKKYWLITTKTTYAFNRTRFQKELVGQASSWQNLNHARSGGMAFDIVMQFHLADCNFDFLSLVCREQLSTLPKKTTHNKTASFTIAISAGAGFCPTACRVINWCSSGKLRNFFGAFGRGSFASSAQAKNNNSLELHGGHLLNSGVTTGPQQISACCVW